MAVPDLAGIGKVHMIGIGGAGMSGIARLMLARGIQVSGSDLKDSHGLEELRREGAQVFVGHRAGQLGSPDAIVISTAIPGTNPELKEARKLGIDVFARAQILAALSRGHKSFAVAGTHGKTTTTSMLSVILEKTGMDPSFVIGGDLNESGSGSRHGEGATFVAEADESDGSFLLLKPEVGIVTNVESDHLNFYTGGEPQIKEAFAAFVESAGTIIACGDDRGTKEVLAIATGNDDVVRYGVNKDNDAVLTILGAEGLTARGRFRLPDGTETVLVLRIPGKHNLLNASAAVIAAQIAGVDPAAASTALESFSGVRRRFERKGSVSGIEFVDDYAHHPTEVAATLAAAGDASGRRLIAAFQPHRYTRTQALWRPLGESLKEADVVVVTDVYPAGESPIPGISGKLLVDALAEVAPGKRIAYLPRRSDVVAFLAAEADSGDLVITLGAGDITMVAGETMDRIRESA
jgi:UDP-N-acetylmuramate--alanine ligase